MARRDAFRRLAGVAVLAGTLLSPAAQAEPGFSDFFVSHPTPMWMIEVASGDIVRANPAAQDFYGYDDLTALNIRDINLLSQSQIEQEIARAATAERNHLFMRHRLADDSVKVMGIYTQRMDYRGQEVLVSSLYDTSEFERSAERHYIAQVEEQVDLQTAQLRNAKRRQAWLAWGAALAQGVAIVILLSVLVRLRRAQADKRRLIEELSFRNRELERLSHAMAHLFQEPSRRLISFAQQLQRRLGDSDDDSTRIAVDFIASQSRRLSALVGDMQRYLSLDRMPFEPRRISPGEILDDVYRRNEALTELRQAQAMTVASPLPDVHFEPKRLALVFGVLLHNAWQYRDAERPLRVTVSATRLNQRIRFAVEDNGRGIAPEYRDQALEMFARLVPNSEQTPGTGMGLALVTKALRCVQGSVYIEPGPQGGTRVVFDLPTAE
ncbi:sensor histidine kinase [Billgrantia kenyensis]|uniref:histidine kinase n=1 Tax=Billgrantia kenyensis TaxID=321266 RepID=A0A7W0AEJ3_9GAMM|nr:HAMP domain-containing sensor histidine kinase [Halomonas kenyensis]MBA2779411.1 HAMP domain-containing histidine kinase [Halomonas kenyensis]MCG6662441.1 HAMP domain-containing histidine kinase [Halomonas kenyensis]